MSDGKREKKGGTALKERSKAKRPKRFKVLLYNDDYTSMEFVVGVLQTIFRMGPSEATAVMLKVHTEGRGIAGVYPHEIAESKVIAVHERARSAGYPLRAGLEEE